MQTAVSSDLIEDIADPTLRILITYCIPYAVKDTGEMFGCWDEDKMDLSVYDHTSTWVISAQDVSWFIEDMRHNEQEVLSGSFSDNGVSSMFVQRYLITKYGIVRIVGRKNFELRYRFRIDRNNGFKWFEPEFLIESYKAMDILCYVPGAKIRNMEYWTKKRVAERANQQFEKQLGVELVKPSELTEKQAQAFADFKEFNKNFNGSTEYNELRADGTTIRRRT